MAYENYVGHISYKYYLDNNFDVDYQYISNSNLDDYGHVETYSSKIESSIRRYAKFYLIDVDENGLLDILIWRKIIQSRKIEDPIKGYKLIGTEYVRYEEGASGFQTIPMSEGAIKEMIESRSLSWDQGFPYENYCDTAGGATGTIPMVIDGKKLADM